MLVGQLGSLLLFIFVADATLAVWRQGGRHQATALGCLSCLSSQSQRRNPCWFSGGSSIHRSRSVCSTWVLSRRWVIELSRDVIRAAQLARELQASEADLRESQRRMDLAATGPQASRGSKEQPGCDC